MRRRRRGVRHSIQGVTARQAVADPGRLAGSPSKAERGAVDGMPSKRLELRNRQPRPRCGPGGRASSSAAAGSTLAQPLSSNVARLRQRHPPRDAALGVHRVERAARLRHAHVAPAR